MHYIFEKTNSLDSEIKCFQCTFLSSCCTDLGAFSLRVSPLPFALCSVCTVVFTCFLLERVWRWGGCSTLLSTASGLELVPLPVPKGWGSRLCRCEKNLHSSSYVFGIILVDMFISLCVNFRCYQQRAQGLFAYENGFQA